MLLFSDFIWILFCSCEIYNFIIKLRAKFVRQILALLRFLKCQPRLCYFCKILYKLSKVKLCFYIIPIKIFTKRIFMNSFLRKTFGGLSINYYLRQLFFGGLITALFFLVANATSRAYRRRDVYIFGFKRVYLSICEICL